jgi:sec-independent protein translocase protein TatB
VFNIGPMEFLILAVVAVIVLGPDRLPGLARDAARMIRTLRDLATGARTQLRDELGPEFADLDLRNLNPRTALQRAILGDEETGLRGELRNLDPREDFRDITSDLREDYARPLHGGDYPSPPAQPETPAEPQVSMRKPPERPLGRGESAPYDEDAT